MQIDHIIPRQAFEGCRSTFEEADIVLFGAGYDGTSSYRPGSRFAPLALRTETYFSQEDYSPYFGKDLKDKKIHDLGDIDLPPGDKKETLNRIFQTVRAILQTQKIPCMIGGEHLVSLPAIQAAAEMHPDLVVVQLDAHLDLMDELFGDRLSHGTVMRRVWEVLEKSNRIYQIGIRSGSKEEFQFAAKHTRLIPFGIQNFETLLPELENKPIYLTVDIDVFDPSLIPGTGTPEAGGIFFPDFIQFLTGMKPLNIVGCDLVELSPKLDPTDTSTIVASKILRELLIILPER